MKKTAIIGASGFLGSYFLAACRRHDPDAIGTTHASSRPDLRVFDLREPDVGKLDLVRLGYESVIISAGISSVAKCESDPRATDEINVEGTLELIRRLDSMGLHVVFLSSDYVFAGDRPPYNDGAEQSPTTRYGAQKATVERSIQAEFRNSCAVRLSRVYSPDVRESHFLSAIFERVARGERHAVPDDQKFRPTPIDEVWRAITAIQSLRIRGIVNVCASETWSRYEVAVALCDLLGKDRRLVERTSIRAAAPGLKLPLDTSMRCVLLRRKCRMRLRALSSDLPRIAGSSTAPSRRYRGADAGGRVRS